MKQNVLHRLSLMILLVLGSASCGFSPVYAPGSKTAAALSDIVVAPPNNNRPNYVFVTELEDRIGRNPNGSKELKHDIWVYEEDPGLVSSTARIHLVGKVTYQVVSVKDGRFLFGGTVENFVAFIVDDNLTTAVRNDATERLMKILADHMVTRLTVQFSRLADD